MKRAKSPSLPGGFIASIGLTFAFGFGVGPIQAATDLKSASGWKKDLHVDHCRSNEEYIQAREFLLKTKDIELPERQIRKVSMQVARGCTGASEVFRTIFELLVKSGVDHKFSLKAALEQSAFSKDRAAVFVESFKRLYLEESLNLDYSTAYKISLELASAWRGPKDTIGKDFSLMVDFCLDPKEMALPHRECLSLALKISGYSKFYPTGVFEIYKSLYTRLRTDKKFSLPVSRAAEVALRVVGKGPRAPENFLGGFEYALSDKGLNESGEAALLHALELVEFSNKTLEPPVVEIQ